MRHSRIQTQGRVFVAANVKVTLFFITDLAQRAARQARSGLGRSPRQHTEDGIVITNDVSFHVTATEVGRPRGIPA